MDAVLVFLNLDLMRYVALFLQFMGALHVALVIAAMVFTLIPGVEPERTLYKIAEIVSRFSRK